MTPYIVPEQLRLYPSGLDWGSIPFPDATTDQQEAALYDLCWRVTDEIVGRCSQELRATVDVETETGPDWRMTRNGDGTIEMRLWRFPVLKILGVSTALSMQWPMSFQPVPLTMTRLKSGAPSAYGTVAPDPAAIGPNAVIVAPAYAAASRLQTTLQVTYLNGWPHCGITTDVLSGATTLTVDDVTGWQGVTGKIYDGILTESLLVAATSGLSGPGTLTLATPVLYDHTVPAGSVLVFSALPSSIQTAAFYLAIEQALVRGANAITVPSLPGAEVHTGRDAGDLQTQADALLAPFKVTAW